jgi:hypothetical protein
VYSLIQPSRLVQVSRVSGSEPFHEVSTDMPGTGLSRPGWEGPHSVAGAQSSRA